MHTTSYICAFCGNEQISSIDIDGQDCLVCENGYYLNNDIEDDEDGKDDPDERYVYDPD